MSKMDTELDEMLSQLAKLADIWIGEGKEPMAIAAAMNVVGLKLYRTMLEEEDYNQMVDSISERRADIVPYGGMRV